MSKTYYIFRHALATYSKDGYGDEILTASILPKETEPIKKMAKYLTSVKESINFSSEVKRAKQTAKIITKITGKKFIFDPRLNEYDTSSKQFLEESFESFYQRIHQFVKDAQKLETENILICSHGAIITGIKNILIKGDFTKDDLFDFPLCGELLIINGKSLRSINFN